MFLFLQWTISGKLPRSYGKQLFCSPMESFAFWFCICIFWFSANTCKTRTKFLRTGCTYGLKMPSWHVPRFHVHSASPPRRRQQLGRHKFAYLTTKNISLARFWRTFFYFLNVSQTLSFFLRCEMTCFAVVWTCLLYTSPSPRDA